MTVLWYSPQSYPENELTALCYSMINQVCFAYFQWCSCKTKGCGSKSKLPLLDFPQVHLWAWWEHDPGKPACCRVLGKLGLHPVHNSQWCFCSTGGWNTSLLPHVVSMVCLLYMVHIRTAILNSSFIALKVFIFVSSFHIFSFFSKPEKSLFFVLHAHTILLRIDINKKLVSVAVLQP